MDAAKIIACLDLTNLNNNCLDADILQLCEQANTPLGKVAAICIYPRFLKFAKSHCPSGVKLATVINFPQARASLNEIEHEAQAALEAGAEELDVVIPYRDVLAGNIETSLRVLGCVKKVAPQTLVKVILETGEIVDPHKIFILSQALLDHGADFLKTSTGKVSVGATVDAVQAMLEALVLHKASSGQLKGLKISGGVRTRAQAEAFIDLAVQAFGEDYIQAKTFRIGASGLLQELLIADLL